MLGSPLGSPMSFFCDKSGVFYDEETQRSN